ncbi:MAG: rRNA maturation RNase YbeY [Acidimicrobiia bacterium]
MTILDDHPTSISGALDALVRDVLIDQACPERVEVCVHTVDAEIIRRHNADAFGKDEPTDVVSFPLEVLVPGAAPTVDPAGPPLVLGDVFVAPDVVAERAARLGFDLDAEMALMTVHGVLHLLGYDHVTDDEAETMEAIETRILAKHGMTRR